MSVNYDLIVLGAGIAGISAARSYLDVQPKANVAVLERDGAVGGTWERERSYPGFKAQASSRMCEFSNMPISVPRDNLDEYDCPDSIRVSEYLEIYLDKHIYDGKRLKDRFVLNSLILKVKKGDDGLWHVNFTRSGQEHE
jgi:cation diffusion facilitator CzcD-associated flavoprotein CzcO